MAAASSQDVRVGIVAFAAVVAIVLGIAWGKGCAIGNESHHYVVLLTDASGIDEGTVVSLRGVRVGSVIGVGLDSTQVRLAVRVAGPIRLFDDATASVQMLELTGGRMLALSPGSSGALLPDGGEIPGTVADLGALLAKASTLGDDASLLLKRVDSVVAALSDLLLRRGRIEDISGSIQNLAAASADLRHLLERNGPHLETTIRSIAVLSRGLNVAINQLGTHVHGTLNTIDTLGADARHVSRSLNEILARADTLTAKIDQIVDDLHNGDGAASRLLFDPATAQELLATIAAVRSLLADIEKNGIKAKVDVDLF